MKAHLHDKTFRKSVERFCRHFNCACSRLKKSNIIISYSTRGAQIPGLCDATRNGRNWQLNATVKEGKLVIHPFALMLSGRRMHAQIASYDIDTYYDMRGGCQAFEQGFANMPTWRDCWDGYRLKAEANKYYSSLYFNLGRAFLSKVVGIHLPYNLPIAYEKKFAQLQ